MPELHLNTPATSMTIMNGEDRKTLNLLTFIFSNNYSFNP